MAGQLCREFPFVKVMAPSAEVMDAFAVKHRRSEVFVQFRHTIFNRMDNSAKNAIRMGGAACDVDEGHSFDDGADRLAVRRVRLR